MKKKVSFSFFLYVKPFSVWTKFIWGKYRILMITNTPSVLKCRLFWLFRFIVFAIHLDITYV